MSEVQTAKMIYADKGVAAAILDKMAKRAPKDKWDVVQLPTGWQVCRITTCAPFMPPAKPLPVMKPGAKQIISGDVVTFVAPFERQTDKWLYFACEQGPGQVRYVHKNHLINFEVTPEKMVTVSMGKWTAIAKGLLAV